MTSLLQRVSVIAFLLAAALPTQAQQLDPAKPIRLIVGLAAGGGTDVTARLVAQKMSESMKMTVLVENKAGGIFIPALREVTNAAPDATRSISSRPRR
jgi:tripartite-type tricarboxylate transporter receptor subunit TctC